MILSAQKIAVVLDLSRSFSSSSAADTKGCVDLSSRCCLIGANMSRSWRRCSGSIARQARDSVALFLQSSVVLISATKKTFSIEVTRKHPVTNRKASCIGLSTRRVGLLWHQTKAEYSAAEWIKARVAVHNVLASEPHLEPTNNLKIQHELSAFYSIILVVNGNARDLYNFIPR